MRITFTTRMGQHPPGTTVDHTHGPWLIAQGYATPAADIPTRVPDTITPPDDTHDAVSDDTDVPGPSLATLRAHAERLGLPIYGSKATLTARIATRG